MRCRHATNEPRAQNSGPTQKSRVFVRVDPLSTGPANQGEGSRRFPGVAPVCPLEPLLRKRKWVLLVLVDPVCGMPGQALPRRVNSQPCFRPQRQVPGVRVLDPWCVSRSKHKETRHLPRFYLYLLCPESEISRFILSSVRPCPSFFCYLWTELRCFILTMSLCVETKDPTENSHLLLKANNSPEADADKLFSFQ